MAGFFETIRQKKGSGQLLAAWIIDGNNAGARMLLSQEELLFRDEDFPEELAEKIRKSGGDRKGILKKAGSRVFMDHLSDGRRLVICGAGHVSLCVIRLGVMLGYEVTVIEDREEFAEKARAAGAHQVICRPFGEALDGITGDPVTAFVIMTREHIHDVECLRRILTKTYAYAGMMGSRSRTQNVRQQLLDEGYDVRKVDDVQMPIGLSIGSRTPEEIAVSVMAQVIQVMNAADPGEDFPKGMPEELAAIEKAENGRGVLAMIVEKSGEAPRRPGTKMLVREDGSFLGTVGGGYAEAVILETARKMVREGTPRNMLIKVSMKKGVMHCGGEIEVLLWGISGGFPIFQGGCPFSAANCPLDSFPGATNP